MPIELGIWRIDKGLKKIQWQSLDKEKQLEEILLSDINILGLDLLLLGKLIQTDHGKEVDLLAIDRSGALTVIELKRNKTSREVVAQVLDYGSWVQDLNYESIAEIYLNFSGKSLELGFDECFGCPLPDELNETHKLVIVAAELDEATERIVTYLNTFHNVPLNTVFFRYFKDENGQYIARSWLIDPTTIDKGIEKKQSEKSGKAPWNGKDFYIALGEAPTRNWEDCVKYGFISAGQGRWYTKTLNQLFVGARVFVHIPGYGYVGAGIVEDVSKRVSEFYVNVKGRDISILTLPLKSQLEKNSDDIDLSEYLVKINWLKTFSREDAVWEKGFFANQNTVCKMRSEFTLKRLEEVFKIDD